MYSLLKRMTSERMHFLFCFFRLLFNEQRVDTGDIEQRNEFFHTQLRFECVQRKIATTRIVSFF